MGGCGGSPLQGRYQRGTAWIEFLANGTVVHGELRDRARVEFNKDDPAAIVLVSGDMRTAGRILDATTVEFSQGTSALADAFEGRWVVAAPDPPRLAADAARDAAAPLLGGTYEMLDPTRVRLNLVQNGATVGRLDHKVSVDGASITLTDPDGLVTKNQRVR